ncbi:AraC family transcriptional regulator [Xanthomonas campestris]|uniref:helix-turn-helix transcriptional regulator n=1 Tax=Xanthomonas campestris TaxID=339 RepID=UPI002B227B14|nr:AraC family transcriptional regulator [Xanthomonas campestris]MEA9553041.1 AraC family transcriptional regulator [Xanthomonas campestris]
MAIVCRPCCTPCAPILQRLQQLCDTITATHAEPWPVQRMAAYLGMGAGRVHALFRDTFDQTPQQWLGALRLQRVCLQLAHTDVPIAQLALVHGWSDQTALTRAMRRILGMTPAAYRRRQQHAGTR